MRKDGERRFGILKRRWEILITALRLKSVGDVNKVWLMCCGLHNWLLEVDGYNVPQDIITQSFNPSFSDLTTEDIPFVLWQLKSVTIDNIADLSGIGEGTDTTSNDNVNNVNVKDNDDVADFGKAAVYGIAETNVVRNFLFKLQCTSTLSHNKELEWSVQNQSIAATAIGR